MEWSECIAKVPQGTSAPLLGRGVKPVHGHALASPHHHGKRETGELCWRKLVRIVPSVSKHLVKLLAEYLVKLSEQYIKR